MNLVAFLVGAFTRHKPDGELERVKQAGRDHARLYATAYRDAFAEEASKVFNEGNQRFLEYHDPDVIDVECEPVPKKPARKGKGKRR